MASETISRSKIIDVLLASPVFGKLDRAVIEDLANELKLQHVPGGYQVIREKEAANEMLFLISGGMRVSRRNAQGELLLYNEIRPGMSFGEAGLILRQPRAADVTAVRDSVIAVLSRDAFESLLNKYPLPINQVVVRAVYNYLRHNEEAGRRTHAQSIAVIPLHRGANSREVAYQLAEAFATVGKTHVLSPPSEKTGRYSVQSLQDMAAYQDALEESSDFLIYEADATASEWSLRAFRQADQVVYVVSAGVGAQVGELENILRAQPDFNMKRVHLAVLHDQSKPVPADARAWLKDRAIERIYPIRNKRPADFSRLVRFLTGQAVGVVLGGGGARGFAHVGVLRAMEEAGIPVDLIGGNSMGALIAAQFACGVPLNDIIGQTRAFASGGERLTLPLVSLVSGNRVARDLRKMFGENHCDGLWIPFFAAACNLTLGKTTVQDSGPVWRAVLASNSPAGLFPPVLLNGEMLVDGAILENVPVDAMRMRLGTPQERRRGNGTVVAIDVDVQEPMAVDPALHQLSAWSALKGYFSPKAHPSPTIADILYRAGHIGGLYQRGATIAQADHYLEPPVSDFTMMSYKRGEEIAEVGYQYASRQIRQWKTRPRS
jgi:predicted acylesterase/phospholipase RssA/CRP-like cAMP-binding protein